MTMGRQNIADKSIRPLTTISSITPAGVIYDSARAGVIPIGNYKGVPAFWDLDKAVNQPLVHAEQLHILGNIDGQTEGTGLATVTVGAVAAGVIVTTTITVPAGQVWYINAVIGTCVADATGTLTYNWRCSLFADALANVLGGVFHTVGLATPLAPQNDEFSAIATVFNIANKPTLLRLPAGTTISAQLTNAAAAAACTGVAGTMQLFGYLGKLLVA